MICNILINNLKNSLAIPGSSLISGLWKLTTDASYPIRSIADINIFYIDVILNARKNAVLPSRKRDSE